MENLKDQMFIKGHFADRLAAGETPDYSIPSSPLPDVKGRSMTIKTGFLGAFGTNTHEVVEEAIAAAKAPGTWE